MRLLLCEESIVIPEEKAFYQALGQRIAKLRKEQSITQVQLAEILGIAQQTLAHYEVGRLRIALATMPALAKALDTTIEELLSDKPKSTSKNKRGPASKLQQQLEQISLLPKTKQRFVMDMLDTVLQQAS